MKHTVPGGALLRPSPPSARPRARLLGTAALAVLLTLAACSSDSTSAEGGGPSQPDPGATAGTGSEPGSDGDGFPLTIENCDETVTVEAAPTRVITMNQGATEIMLALGLEDHVIGTAYLDDAVLPEFQEAYDAIPVLAEEYPSAEVVRGEGPDLVYGSYASAFGDEAAGDRAGLEAAGITSYLSPNNCRATDGTPITFDDVFAEIREIGAIFGVADRAEALITGSQERISTAVEGLPADLTAFWYDSGTDTPTTGGCCGAPAMLMEALGLENVFSDIEGGWGDGSWETVVDADPDVIVLVDASWDTIDAKRDALAAPPMASLRAVQDEQYLTVPFSATTPGVRNVAAVEDMAAELHALLGG